MGTKMKLWKLQIPCALPGFSEENKFNRINMPNTVLTIFHSENKALSQIIANTTSYSNLDGNICCSGANYFGVLLVFYGPSFRAKLSAQWKSQSSVEKIGGILQLASSGRIHYWKCPSNIWFIRKCHFSSFLVFLLFLRGLNIEPCPLQVVS